MPVPDRAEWRRRWERPILQRLGISGDEIERGYARMLVTRTPEADDLLHRSAIGIAADIAAVSAVTSQLDERQQANGTAELHLSFVAPPDGAVSVSARIAHWADYAAHLEIEARGPGGDLLARGLTTYSLRPVTGDG